MDERLTTLLADIARAAELAGPDLPRAQRRAAWLTEASGEEQDEFLSSIADLAEPLSPQGDALLAAALAGAVRAKQAPPASDTLQRLYHDLGADSHARAHLLAWIAQGNEPQLALLGNLLVADPPREDADVVLGLAPLFQRRDAAPLSLFPRLLAALAHPPLAAPVIDLANYLARARLAPRHPAADRGEQLASLLGQLAQSLGRLEEAPQEADLSPVELSRQVAAQVALAVSLCDALALIGDPTATGKLHQVLALRHRRLRTEAAAALARLGDETGKDELLKLAEEPVARLRVLAYAEELGLRSEIDPQWQTPQARGEAELAVWLAEPTQFGIPPARVELFDRTRQFWPGYNEPIDCFLFRFTYVVTLADEGERSLSNIGIAGPLAHAFLADLADLPPDDIYAAYAGWQTEHDEIREYDVARLSRGEKLEIDRLSRRLHDAGYTDIEPRTMGYFFGEKALVAQAAREGVPGVAVADFQEIAFFPQRHSRRPLGPREGYCIYKGRKLLKSFNSSERFEPG